MAKKTVRLAVGRNRIKRVIRESYRVHQQMLNGLDIVIVGFHGVGELKKTELRCYLDREWVKLAKLYQKP